MENRFKAGEIVVERSRPSNRLIITRFEGGLYYCKPPEPGRHKELAYLERDLKPELVL